MSQPPNASPDQQNPATGAPAVPGAGSPPPLPSAPGSAPSVPAAPPAPPAYVAPPAPAAPQTPAAPTPPAVPQTPTAPPAVGQTPPAVFGAASANADQSGAPGYPQQSQPGFGQQPYGQQPPTGYGQQQQAFAAPNQQTQFPQYGQAVSAPTAPKKGVLGVVALIASALGLVAGSVVAFIFAGPVAKKFAEYVSANGKPESFDSIDLSFFVPVRGEILGLEISAWIAAILGLIGIVLGIIAAVTRRGKSLAIAAIIVGVVSIAAWCAIVWMIFQSA